MKTLAMLALLPLLCLGCGKQATAPDQDPPATPGYEQPLLSDEVLLVTAVTLLDGTPVPRGAALADETVVVVYLENRPKVVTWGQIKAMWQS